MLYHFSRIVKDFFSYLQKFAIIENESASRLIFLFVGLADDWQAKNRRTRRRKNIFLKLFLKLYFCIFIISVTLSQTGRKPYKIFVQCVSLPDWSDRVGKLADQKNPRPQNFQKFFYPTSIFEFSIFPKLFF